MYLAGAASCALAVGLVALWLLGRYHLPVLSVPEVRTFLYPDYHFTLYPIYLGTAMLGMAFLVRRQSVSRIERVFEVFGKTSLFTYVVQYFVVQTLPWALGLGQRMSLPQVICWYLASLAAIWAMANAWNIYVKKV